MIMNNCACPPTGRRAAKPKPKFVMLRGKRWMDSFGNTYHTVSISVDSEHVGNTSMEYGYGSKYEDTAIDWLVAHGYLAKPRDTRYGRPAARTVFKRNRVQYGSEVRDVKRKRDL